MRIDLSVLNVTDRFLNHNSSYSSTESGAPFHFQIQSRAAQFSRDLGSPCLRAYRAQRSARTGLRCQAEWYMLRLQPPTAVGSKVSCERQTCVNPALRSFACQTS